MRPERSAVKKRCVTLNQGCTTFQPLDDVRARLDAADRDHAQLLRDHRADESQNLERPSSQWCAGQTPCPAALDQQGRRAESVAGDGRIGRGDAVEAQFHHQPGDLHDLLVAEVWGDLDQNRDAAGRIPDRRQEGGEHLELLQPPQTQGVRRTDVDHEIVGYGSEQSRALQVVIDGIRDIDDPALPDVHADDGSAGTGSERAEPRCRIRRAAVVEAHPIDDRLVFDQPEQPGPVVARLRQRRDRAHLDVAEPELPEAQHGVAVLVETRSHPERRIEVHPERVDAE